MQGKNLAQAKFISRSYRYRGKVARTQIHTKTRAIVIAPNKSDLVLEQKKIRVITIDIK